MSLVMDEKSTTSNSPDVRVPTRKRSNLGVLNPDSPRTIDACLELGINPQDLRQKPPESFVEPNTPEDIVKLRYNHYLNRYNQTVKDVTAKRREIARSRRYQAAQQQQSNTTTDQQLAGRGTRPGSVTNLNNAKQHCISVPTSLLANYHKTVSYLRSAQQSPVLKKPEELLHVDEETKQFDKMLFHEVEKFNSMKKMKQKEALRVYEDDLKRIKLITDINERAKRKEEIEAKMKAEMIRSRKEKLQRIEEKQEMIKEREKSFNEKRKKAEEQLRKKFDEKAIKLQEEKQERARSLQEHEQRLAEKKRRADEIRMRHEKLIETGIEMLDQRIRDKMYESQEKHEQVMNSKIESIRAKMGKLSEKVQQMQEMKMQKEEEFLHELIDKVKEKEKKNQEFEKKREKENRERLKRLKAKNDNFLGNTRKLKSEERKWLSVLEQRQKRAQERVEERKLEEQHRIRLKQELRRLKQLDNQENYERKRRMIEFEQNRILEKEREMAEKIQFIKTQKEIVQKARLEGSIQAKLERDRITDVIVNLSKKVRLKDSDKVETVEDLSEEKKLEQPPAQIQNPAENQQSPQKKSNDQLKKLNERGIKYLSKVVPIGDQELNEIDQIISGSEIFLTRKRGSATPSMNTSAYHIK